MTPLQRTALEFIRDNPGCRASTLAEHLWPHSRMHSMVSNQGHGATRGKAAWLCGGSYAAKLAYAGLVRSDFLGNSYTRGYWITREGTDALKIKS